MNYVNILQQGPWHCTEAIMTRLFEHGQLRLSSEGLDPEVKELTRIKMSNLICSPSIQKMALKR